MLILHGNSRLRVDMQHAYRVGKRSGLQLSGKTIDQLHETIRQRDSALARLRAEFDGLECKMREIQTLLLRVYALNAALKEPSESITLH